MFRTRVECCNYQYMFNFQKICLTSYMKINIYIKYKYKIYIYKFNSWDFVYVLEKIFIVNLKKKITFWRYTFYEFQGQSKGHKVKYLRFTCS